MGVPGSANLLLLGGEQGYKISRSLRFNSADSAYLNRTPASAGNRRTWTWSGWVKFSAISVSSNGIFEAATNSSNRSVLAITGNSQLQWYDSSAGSTVTQLVTSQVFRDFSAWYHIIVAVDTTQATSSNRVKIYVNGSQVTAFGTSTYPSQNFDTQVNASVVTVLGAGTAYTPSAFYDGYLTEINFIDGQALTPSSFGETDTITGVWKPKKYTGTYSGNSFYLNFSDNSGTTSTTLGKDSSGNGNNWTPNNFSVTAGAGNDSLTDTPTPYADGGNGRGNYATLNPLDTGNSEAVLSNGNLEVVWSNVSGHSRKTTISVSSGKWYCEITRGSVHISAGLISGSISSLPTWPGNTTYGSNGSYGYASDTGNIRTNGSNTAYGASYASGDVVGIAFDASSGKLWFSKNGVWQNSGDPAAGTNAAFTGITGEFAFAFGYYATGAGSNPSILNCGQRAFTYTPPSGFLALNTQNLPDPTIKKPGTYMDVVTYTGNGGTQTLSSLNFSPDLVWIKSRSVGYDHQLTDSVRGTGKELQSDLTGAETSYGLVSALNSNGFTVFTNGTYLASNANGTTYVAWCWDKSATPGFDIVTFTATSTSMTVNHSLGVTPDLVLLKRRDSADNWFVNHSSFATRTGNYLVLNSTQAITSSATTFTGFSSTTVSFGSGLMVNTATYVAYLWSEVAGFSKFGSYTGNNSTDGPFVYCGFAPKWIMIKSSTNAATPWQIFDSVRETGNTIEQTLIANGANAEPYDTASPVDFLSNGFKLRGSASSYNNYNTGTWIFAAFAETPAKYSLAR